MQRASAGPHPEAHARHHLRVVLDRATIQDWQWTDAAACDRRAWLRGMLLGSASISIGARGSPRGVRLPQPFAAPRSCGAGCRRVAVAAAMTERRGRSIVYVKGHEEIATLLRLTGANRAVLDFETARVGREVQNRLNRLLNAEAANLDRTVRAAERQLAAIDELEAPAASPTCPLALRETVAARRLQPDADLDTLATSLGVSRSAVNHRLRRLVELGAVED